MGGLSALVFQEFPISAVADKLPLAPFFNGLLNGHCHYVLCQILVTGWVPLLRRQ